jgi:hypothetical protein
MNTTVHVHTTDRFAFKAVAAIPEYQSSIGLLLASRQARHEAMPFFHTHCLLDCGSAKHDVLVKTVPAATRAAMHATLYGCRYARGGSGRSRCVWPKIW